MTLTIKKKLRHASNSQKILLGIELIKCTGSTDGNLSFLRKCKDTGKLKFQYRVKQFLKVVRIRVNILLKT